MKLTKTLKLWAQKLIPGHKTPGDRLQAKIIPRPQHSVSRKSISRNALNVLYRLDERGFEGYLVGGCVRDLLLGLRPKDFDIATDAKPEQMKRLFSNCRLIGRRFRLAHVYFGRDVIEVATFRAGPSKESPKHLTSDTGMLLRDNVFGTVDEDAVRRDFTVNALYYRISDFAIIDFCNGMHDIEHRILRLIGEPDQRYREDPVRMLRAARFAAKLGFEIHPDTKEPIPRLTHLLSDVPSARIFEECLKLFMSGHGVKSLALLRELGILAQLIPAIQHYEEQDWTLVQEGLRDTDERIGEHETTAPGYLFATLLWPMYQLYFLKTSENMPPLARKHEAMDNVFRDLNPSVAVPKRISLMTCAIWELQHRLESVRQHQLRRLLDHPYFGAAFDFLILRADTQEPELKQTVQWWKTAEHATGETLEQLCKQLPKQSKRRTRRKPKRKNEVNE